MEKILSMKSRGRFWTYLYMHLELFLHTRNMLMVIFMHDSWIFSVNDSVVRNIYFVFWLYRGVYSNLLLVLNDVFQCFLVLFLFFFSSVLSNQCLWITSTGGLWKLNPIMFLSRCLTIKKNIFLTNNGKCPKSQHWYSLKLSLCLFLAVSHLGWRSQCLLDP